MKGKLVTFEGIDKCGKSTQVQLLKSFLDLHEIQNVVSREPGGTSVGKKIRSVLLENNEPLSSMSELFLFLADRNQHVHEVIQPALESGKIVVLDRYYHSTFAYQSAGRKLPIDRIKMLNKEAIEGVRPDVTFFIDVPVDVSFKRKHKEQNFDRMEMENKQFFNRVRQAFFSFVMEEKNFVVLDGTKTPLDIHTDIVSYLINNNFGVSEF